MTSVGPSLTTYEFKEVDELITPALIVYPDIVQQNIAAAIHMMGDDSDRWRPHLKTSKSPSVVRELSRHRVKNVKCSTTLELSMACHAGAADILLAYPVMGATARRTAELASACPATRVSVLVESWEQASVWRGHRNIGIFLDVNSGMNRTGIDENAVARVLELARKLDGQFRGLHYYDGHISGAAPADREEQAHRGYDKLLKIIEALEHASIPVEEVITSGTPAAPFAISYPGFRDRQFIHRVSPGTIVYNDLSSLEQLPQFGFQPAALVLTTVVSRPTPHIITCDAGHKSVSADAGVPTCAVVGHPDWKPLKPSEEHLPIEIPANAPVKLGDKLYLLPRHICPTVNNFDDEVLVIDNRIRNITRVAARGHEAPAESARYQAFAP
jgi:D-serine deaminase-like pyridoxal phosphate-dependent protein